MSLDRHLSFASSRSATQFDLTQRILPILLLLTTLPALAQRTLTCTIVLAPSEYTLSDLHGPRPLFDLELCRAVGAALQVKAVPIEAADESAAIDLLRAGHADLVPTLSADLTHATDPTLTLTPPILLDAVGLLAPTATPSAASLAGRKICFFSGTETETSLHTWFRIHHLDFLPYPFSEEGEMQAALSSGNCPAIAGDLTRLASVRTQLTHPDAWHLLPETLAPDPLASATRSSDPALGRVVLAVEQLLLNADILGITRANLSTQLKSQDPALQRLLGFTHELGPAANLDDAWPSRVLQAVGNYAEIGRRTLPLVLPTPPALPLK